MIEVKLNTQLFKELSKPKMTKLEKLKAAMDAAYEAVAADAADVYVAAHSIAIARAAAEAVIAYHKELKKQEKENKDD
tara:strand:- start:505 stop:738 length:234 start_codon:yes stop_codon:yes gene_type:complete